MFKKNANRPPMVVSLKRVQGGYKVTPNEGHALFQVKRIIRTMYRPDLAPQSGLRMEQNGLIPSTIIQPPSHFTLPAFALWFSLDLIHPIEQEAFPQFFEPERQALPLSFATRNAKLYKYYRNSMVGMWLQNVKKHLSAAHCRRLLVGDVSLIIRIHGFLENWGIINFPSREHSKGLVLKHSQRLSCHICEDSSSDVYHVTPIEDIIFQVCHNCFEEGLYPSGLKLGQFVQILGKRYDQPKHRLMNCAQLSKLLDCLSAGGGREKEKDIWATAQKEFSQFSKEELLFNFLRVPQVAPMNANIFDSNEDLGPEPQPQEDPSVFEDFQNPLQASLAIAYFRLKTGGDPLGRVAKIFEGGEKHARALAGVQESKIGELTKMLVDVSYSKLELKSIFIQEYEKLVEKCLLSQRTAVENTLAQCLKHNIRFIEKGSVPEELLSP